MTHPVADRVAAAAANQEFFRSRYHHGWRPSSQSPDGWTSSPTPTATTSRALGTPAASIVLIEPRWVKWSSPFLKFFFHGRIQQQHSLPQKTQGRVETNSSKYCFLLSCQLSWIVQIVVDVRVDKSSGCWLCERVVPVVWIPSYQLFVGERWLFIKPCVLGTWFTPITGPGKVSEKLSQDRYVCRNKNTGIVDRINKKNKKCNPWWYFGLYLVLKTQS